MSFDRMAAFSLVEISLALGVASVSLISILGLLPVGLGNAQSANSQTGAMNLATAIAADIRVTQSGKKSPRYAIDPTDTGGVTLYFDESGTSSSVSRSRYKAVIQAVTPALPNQTVDRVVVMWPPQAQTGSGKGSVDITVSALNNYP
ncbi:MAG: hypothetical protein ACFUZC_14595 [Chthoniobacteraceae bacterium]